MARGDMAVDVLSVANEVEILNRKENEAVAMTVDFTGISSGVVKAGTPVSKLGVPISATPWSGAVGILMHDVYAERPQGACLKKAYINSTRAQANSGLTYDAALTTALNAAGCRIAFEDPII